MTGLSVAGLDALPRRYAAMCRSFTAALLALFVVALDAPPLALAHPHPLPRTQADASAIAETLRAHSYSAADAFNVRQDDFGRLRAFLDEAANVGPQVVTFLYYPGQATQFDSEKYLVPIAEPSISTDTDLDSAEYIMPGCRQFLVSNTQFHFLEGNCNGIVETLEFMSPDLCVPPGSTLGDAVRIVVQYIDARPIRQQENFRLLALEALASAWSCRR
jgi:hypothetical protein